MDDLAARLDRLEAIEAVRQLKADYCRYADENSDAAAEKFSQLFTPDAILDEGEELGVVQGRDALIRIHRHFWKGLKLNQHFAFSPSIKVDGVRASAHWRLLQLINAIHPEGDRAFWACGAYDETYLRTEEGWRIAHVKAEVDFCCPYEDGWARTPFADAIPADIVAGLTAAAAGDGS